MDLYQPIAKHVVWPLHSWKDGSRRLAYLRQFERTQYLPLDQTLERQWEAVQRIVRHAHDHCPYYREKCSAADVLPGDLKTPADFQRIPVLSKTEIQEHAPEMVADNLPKSQIVENFTGGSTGRPLRLFVDRDRWDSRDAGIFRHNRWAGWDLGEKTAYLWGAVVDKPGLSTLKARLRNRLMDRTLFLDTSHVTRDTMAEFVRRLRRFRPRYFVAYAGAIALFARYVQESGLVGRIVPRSIITSAEVLTDDDRRMIEETFQCKVFDRYACREASVLASECERHDGMHVNAESVYLEFVRNGNPVPVGTLGKILMTDLRNRAMPLIRYEIGDVGIPKDGACACGRGLPLMQMAAGRVTDFIVDDGGSLVSGIVLATYVITKVPGARQVQFYQERAGEVHVRIVADQDFQREGKTTLCELLAQRLGNRTKVELELVDEIPTEQSGKFRFTISAMDPLAHLV